MMLLSAVLLFCVVSKHLAKTSHVLNEKWKDTPVVNMNNNCAAQYHNVSSTVAKCLDGSPPKFYVRPGANSGASKWIVFLESGGWCFDDKSCYERSKTSQGSSTFPCSDRAWPKYLSPDQTANPLMHDWNTVYVHYCDGGSFAGNRRKRYMDKVQNISTDLYYQGLSIRDEILKDLLKNQGMAKATDIIIAGESAGGQAVLMGIDAMAFSIRKEVERAAMQKDGFFDKNDMPIVAGLVVSGVFYDYPTPPRQEPVISKHRQLAAAENHTSAIQDTKSNYSYTIINVTAPSHVPKPTKKLPTPIVKSGGSLRPNASAVDAHLAASIAKAEEKGWFSKEMRNIFHKMRLSPNQQCIEAHTKHKLRRGDCMFTEYQLKYIKTPLFLIQSKYDTWNIKNVLKLDEKSPKPDIERLVGGMGEYMGKSITTAMSGNGTNQKFHGLYLDSCSFHSLRCIDHKAAVMIEELWNKNIGSAFNNWFGAYSNYQRLMRKIKRPSSKFTKMVPALNKKTKKSPKKSASKSGKSKSNKKSSKKKKKGGKRRLAASQPSFFSGVYELFFGKSPVAEEEPASEVVTVPPPPPVDLKEPPAPVPALGNIKILPVWNAESYRYVSMKKYPCKDCCNCPTLLSMSM